VLSALSRHPCRRRLQVLRRALDLREAGGRRDVLRDEGQHNEMQDHPREFLD
jgi:hypothetical protein